MKKIETNNSEVIAGKVNDLAFVPRGYVSLSDANRKYGLTDDELLPLKSSAIVATKFGQEGIFYPLKDIELSTLI